MRRPKLDLPPRWAILSLILLAAANVALFTQLGQGRTPPDTYSGTTTAKVGTSLADDSGLAAPTARPAATTAPPLALTLAVYGDGYAAGGSLGGLGNAGWPALVAKQTGLTLSLHAVARAGYVTPGADDQTIPALVNGSPAADATVTILFAGRNDARAAPAQVRAAVAQAIETVRETAPNTALVIIGPVWTGAGLPSSLTGIRDAVARSAQDAGVPFVDPLAKGWFVDQSTLVGSDGVSPNDQGHAYLATLIAPIVRSSLAGAAAPTG